MTTPGGEFGTLVVVVLKARNLPDKHVITKQDPYTTVRLGSSKASTKVDKRGGQHPEWDEDLHIKVSSNASKESRTLKLACFSKEPGRDNLIGEGELDVTNTLETGEFDDWVTLNDDKSAYRGEIYLEMTFFATGPRPAKLERRPSKLPPSERLSRLQQRAAQTPVTAPLKINPGQRRSSKDASQPQVLQHRYSPPNLLPSLRPGSQNAFSQRSHSPHLRSDESQLPFPGEANDDMPLPSPGNSEEAPLPLPGESPRPAALRSSSDPVPAALRPGPVGGNKTKIQHQGALVTAAPATAPASVSAHAHIPNIYPPDPVLPVSAQRTCSPTATPTPMSPQPPAINVLGTDTQVQVQRYLSEGFPSQSMQYDPTAVIGYRLPAQTPGPIPALSVSPAPISSSAPGTMHIAAFPEPSIQPSSTPAPASSGPASYYGPFLSNQPYAPGHTPSPYTHSRPSPIPFSPPSQQVGLSPSPSPPRVPGGLPPQALVPALTPTPAPHMYNASAPAAPHLPPPSASPAVGPGHGGMYGYVPTLYPPVSFQPQPQLHPHPSPTPTSHPHPIPSPTGVIPAEQHQAQARALPDPRARETFLAARYSTPLPLPPGAEPQLQTQAQTADSNDHRDGTPSSQDVQARKIEESEQREMVESGRVERERERVREEEEEQLLRERKRQEEERKEREEVERVETERRRREEEERGYRERREREERERREKEEQDRREIQERERRAQEEQERRERELDERRRLQREVEERREHEERERHEREEREYRERRDRERQEREKREREERLQRDREERLRREREGRERRARQEAEDAALAQRLHEEAEEADRERRRRAEEEDEMLVRRLQEEAEAAEREQRRRAEEENERFVRRLQEEEQEEHERARRQQAERDSAALKRRLQEEAEGEARRRQQEEDDEELARRLARELNAGFVGHRDEEASHGRQTSHGENHRGMPGSWNR